MITVSAIGVSRTYATAARRRRGADREHDVEAIARVDLDVAAGERVAVVGPSGCGKSTLLRLLGGLERPSAGTISVDRRSPDDVRTARQVAWMAQQPALLPWRTVRDNVVLGHALARRGESVAAEIDVDLLLERVGLGGFADAWPAALSGGMQQRAALARAIMTGAPLWLMDEPFAAVDELTRETLGELLVGIWAEARPTVVWVTHHVAEAVRLCDRVVVLSYRPGRVVGEVAVPLTHPRDEASAEVQLVVQEIRSLLRASAFLDTGLVGA